MKTRIYNLRALIANRGAYTVADTLECSQSYLSQLAGPNPTRPITEKTARKIEKALRLAPGAMDAE